MRFDQFGAVSRLIGAVLAGLSFAASSAELSIYSAGAVKAALGEVTANYEKITGDRVAVEYTPVGPLMRRLAEGSMPDAVVLSAETMAEAESRGWVALGTTFALGGVGVGVAVREGAVVPDISTPESFRKTLIAAKSITYIDPEKGTSGRHFAEVLSRLGIADAMKAKTTLGDSGYVVEPVARGEIELGIQQITEILPVKGVKLVGPLPESLQKVTVYSIAQSSKARDPVAVRRFLAYLHDAESRKIFSSKGFLLPQPPKTARGN